jgi:hypothetical protein
VALRKILRDGQPFKVARSIMRWYHSGSKGLPIPVKPGYTAKFSLAFPLRGIDGRLVGSSLK